MRTTNLRLTFVSVVLAGLLLLAGDPAWSEGSEDFASVDVIAVEELEKVRGRDRDTIVVQQNNQTQTANITDTSFDVGGDMNNGSIQFDTGALDNFNGIGLFNNVSGNGNAIDAAIGVNVYLQ